MFESHEILGEDGALARHITDFKPRLQQQEMAAAVMQALNNKGLLIAEAGTGTGKTFAYLVPAVLSGLKVVISTGTKNLQDQLFHKDLPVVREALAVPLRVALLKGRANYLCHYRMDLAEREGRFASREEIDQLQSIIRWAGKSRSGDIAEMDEISEGDPLWSTVTSTTDNCLGQECPAINDCFLMQARRKAQEADVVVINHHLFFADLALRGEGFAELLPDADAFILDEAHQLPEIAGNFFGESISANQLQELTRDIIAEDLREAGEDQTLVEAANRLKKAVMDLRLAFGVQQRRGPWSELSANSELQDGIEDLLAILDELEEILAPMAGRGKGLENCLRRTMECQVQFRRLTLEVPEGYIHWFETFRRGFSINITPLDVANTFRRYVESHPGGWVFTSATLSVGGSFDHYVHQLGLDDAETACWDSPFDYPNQALIYVPPEMPAPNTTEYTQAVIEAALPALEASEGRAFLLFTSHRALQEAAKLLEDRIDYPLLIQGEMPRSRLLEQFRQTPHAVLLGTGSFWEGVDVRGDALSLVVIDKLPFASPGDPITQARIEALKEKGVNAFFSYQLPEAVITLKQGVGRLIRDVNDTGVLMLCDPRVIDKPYGKTFLDSLPAMRRTRKIDLVKRFYAYYGNPIEEKSAL